MIRYCNGIIEPLSAREFVTFFDERDLGTHPTLHAAKERIAEHVALLLEQNRLGELLLKNDPDETTFVAFDLYHLGLVECPHALRDRLYEIFKQRNPDHRPVVARKQRQDGRGKGQRSSSWRSRNAMRRRVS